MKNPANDTGGESDTSALDVEPKPVRAIPLNRLTDSELLFEFTEHCLTEAMQVFVERHENKVMAVCRNVTSNQNDANDAFQATFLAALKHARKLQNVNSHCGWLCRVAYNAALKVRKLRCREINLDCPISLAKVAEEPESETWQVIENRETNDCMIQELFRLPKLYQDCVILFYFEGLSRSETAFRMGRTEASVKAILERGRRLLKSRLMSRGIGPASEAWTLHLPICSLLVTDTGPLLESTLGHCDSFIHSNKEAIPELIWKLSDVSVPFVSGGQLVSKSILVATLLMVACSIGFQSFSNTATNRVVSFHIEPSFESAAPPRNEFNRTLSQPDSAIMKDSRSELMLIKSELEQEVLRKESRLAQLGLWQKHKLEYIKNARTLDEASQLQSILKELNAEAAKIESALRLDQRRLSEIRSTLNRK